MQFFINKRRNINTPIYLLFAFVFCIQIHARIINEEYISAANSKNIAEAKDLLEKAIETIKTKDLFEACNMLNNDKQWQKENIKLILFDRHGVIWLLQSESFRLWTGLFLQKIKTFDNIALLEKIRTEKETQWLNLFSWQGNLISGYFKNFKKDENDFTLGSLLFFENAKDQVHEKVLKTKKYFDDFGIDNTLFAVNNPRGVFLTGALSIAIYNDAGVCLANSFDQTLVGNRSDLWQDQTGESIFKGFQTATQKNQYGWIENDFAGEIQRTFVLKIKDPATSKHYYIASGYYPDANDNLVIKMANNARDILTKEGSQKAFNLLNKRKKPFYKARLATIIYNDQGVIMAHSKLPYLKGVNAFNDKDQGGYLIVQEILNRILKEEKIWTYSYTMNSMQPIYAEKITLPEGTFIISIQGYTPSSLRQLCAQRAEFVCRRMLYESPTTTIQSLNFKHTDSEIQADAEERTWFHGDSFMEMYDQNNFCIAAGPHYHKLWDRLDDQIVQRVKELRTKNHESAWFEYKKNSKNYYVYLRLCSHNYLLVSGYQSFSGQS